MRLPLLSCLLVLALTGCAVSPKAPGDLNLPDEVHSLHGIAHGGQQPLSGTTIQIYAVGTTGDASAAKPLLTHLVTTSDGTGNASNSNANASNGYNSYPTGTFAVQDTNYCPSPSSQVYITGTGGNPGLAAGTNNPSIALMAMLGTCGNLSSATSVSVNELTTVGSLAPLAPYMSSLTNFGYNAATDSAAFLEAVSLVSQYTDTAAGVVPGPTLPAGYYASSTEIDTLADVLASCVNSTGGTGTTCPQIFSLSTPSGGTAPTDTIAATAKILNNPTLNTASIVSLASAMSPFQPILAATPQALVLPIVPIAATPVISLATGTYPGTQSVTLSDATTGSSIYYTVNGTTPSASNGALYAGSVSVAASETLKAVAVAPSYGTSATAGATYTIITTVAPPTITPGTGSYSTSPTITLATTTGVASIYYTIDGSTPSATNGALYAAPFLLNVSATLKAAAVYSTLSSTVTSAIFSLSLPNAAAPTFSLASGTYSAPQTVSIATTTPGASIFYTVNGTAPTSGSFSYTGPITLTANQTLEAIAVAPSYNNSTVTTATYNLYSYGIINAYAGNGTGGYAGDGGAAGSAKTTAEFNTLQHMAVDASGNLYIADTGNNRIRKVTTTGIVTTVAGNGTYGYTGDGGLATSAELGNPYGVALDSAGNLYIADTNNNVIREVIGGKISTIAGNGYGSFGGDGGPATAAQLYQPNAVTVDAAGNIYIADTQNNRVREVTGGKISTIAGGGTGYGFGGDGGPATSALLNNPWDVVVDASGNIYIADAVNNVVRKVTAGQISTVAGNYALTAGCSGCYGGDGGPAIAAQLSQPESIALDSGGNLYIADYSNNVVRKVNAAGTISTIAGLYNTCCNTGDGTPAVGASLDYPVGLALDSSDNVYIADQSQRVRKVTYQATQPAAAQPTFSLAAGSYSGFNNALNLTTTTTGASIYYTIDGTTPTTSSTQYTGTIYVGYTQTVNAIAAGGGYAPSPVGTAAYTVLVTAIPVITPAGGYTATETVQVSITDATPGVSIYYTTNNTIPSATNGTLYAGPFTVSSSVNVEAVALRSGYATGGYKTVSFTLPPALPVINPASTNYAYGYSFPVSISTTTTGASIYYTTDGSTPVPNSGTTKLYSTSFNMTAPSTVQAIAVQSGHPNSPVATSTYLATGYVQFSLNSSTVYTYVPTMVLSIADPNVSIYYAIGSSNTYNLYTGPFTVPQSETVFAYALGTGWAQESSAVSVTVNLPTAAPPTLYRTNSQTPANYYVITGTSTTPNSFVSCTIVPGSSKSIYDYYYGWYGVEIIFIAGQPGTATLSCYTYANGYNNSSTVSATFTYP